MVFSGGAEGRRVSKQFASLAVRALKRHRSSMRWSQQPSALAAPADDPELSARRWRPSETVGPRLVAPSPGRRGAEGQGSNPHGVRNVPCWTSRSVLKGSSRPVRPPLPPHCPPADATDTEGEFLRFTRSRAAIGAVTAAQDWLLPYEDPTSPGHKQTENCQAHALSLLRDEKDIVKARKLVPSFRRRSVAKVVLRPGMGRLKRTPGTMGKSHYSWWPEPVGVVPEATVVLDALGARS